MLAEHYLKPAATTTICAILMTWAMLTYRMLECICNTFEVRLPCKSKPYPGNTGLEEHRARWTDSWLKGLAQRPFCSPEVNIEANTVATPPLMMSLVVQSAPSASLLMWWVEGGAWLCCHPARLRQAGEMGWQELHQVNKDKYQVLGRNNHMHQYMLGSTTWKAALQERTW